MDIFARALITADNIMQKSDYKKIRADRLHRLKRVKGKILRTVTNAGRPKSLRYCHGEPALISGKQEYIENLINKYGLLLLQQLRTVRLKYKSTNLNYEFTQYTRLYRIYDILCNCCILSLWVYRRQIPVRKKAMTVNRG
jgi:hypothetical protein